MADRILLRIDALATELRLSKAWLRTEADAGRVPFIQAGRIRLFSPEAVLDALAERAGRRDQPNVGDADDVIDSDGELRRG